MPIGSFGNSVWRRLTRPGFLGYILYSASVIFILSESAEPTHSSMVRQMQYLSVTYIVCLVILTISSVMLQRARALSLRLLSIGLSIWMLALCVQSFAVFPLTTISLFAGFLIIEGSELEMPFALSISSVLIFMYAFPSIIEAVAGKNVMIAENAAVPSPLFRFGASLVLGVIALGSSLARAVFLSGQEAESTVHHLDTTINQLSKINQDLQQYARTIDEEAISRERNRISREIHDISGYRFTNVIALMDAAISMGGRDPERLQELYLAARNQARDGLLETRRALRALRADELHIKHGISAIYKICSVFEQVTGIKITIESGNIPNSFGPDIDMAVYRLVQEALTNAMRHGRATAVSIYFWIHDEMLEIVVQDNGIGAQQVVKGIGLSGMEERLASFGGTLETGSVPEGGFRLKALIPLALNSTNTNRALPGNKIPTMTEKAKK
ncbi:MAG: sensor histidine kinase [Rectinema subterraneum]|uniref:sensor histidine kinase n=1 Tax=Rectinema subterraneum TaxID=2653714 RepID=UPI003C7E0D96